MTFTSDAVDGSVAYTVTPPLPAGLTLEASSDGASAQIVGSPTTPSASADFTVTALHETPDPVDPATKVTTSTSATVSIRVDGHLIASVASAAGSVQPPVAPPVSLSSPDLVAPLDFTIDPPLPAGLTLGADGAVTGAPTTPSPQAVYVVTATDAHQARASAAISLRIGEGPLAASTSTIVGILGVPVTDVTFGEATWKGVTYALDPTPPAGLIIDGSGALSWTPAEAVPATVFTVTAEDSTGEPIATTTVQIRVSSLNPPLQVLRATVGQAITPTLDLVPLGLGQGVTYSATLPPGLAIHPTFGRVTGRPTETMPASDVVITARDESGATATTVLSVTVDSAQLLPPTILGVKAATSPGSLRVAFAGSANAPTGQQYRAEIYDSSGTTLVRTIAPFSVLTDVTDLTPGAGYVVIIVADPSAGFLGSRSAPKAGLAAPLGEKLAPPAIISVTGGAAPGTIVVSFAPSSGAPAGQVYTALVLGEDQTTLITSQSGTTGPFTLAGLVPGTRYYIVVVAEAGSGFLEARSRGRFAVASGPVIKLTGLNSVVAVEDSVAAARTGQRIAAGWYVLPSTSSASVLRMRVRAALAPTLAQASTVRIPRNKAVVLRMKRPRGTRVMGADLRAGGAWIALGPMARQSAASVDLPVLRATNAGTFALRLRCLNGTSVYLKVMVSRQ